MLTVAGLDADLLEQVGLQAVHASAQEKMTAIATRGQVLGTPPLSEVLLIDPSGWFTTGKELDLLTAARERRRIRLCYRRSGETSGQWLTADPYGLVNKAGSGSYAAVEVVEVEDVDVLVTITRRGWR
ncbi:transcriptional regulator [Cutibacterium modestum]|nr:transcriptional regulator [Cutibacterium modestum]